MFSNPKHNQTKIAQEINLSIYNAQKAQLTLKPYFVKDKVQCVVVKFTQSLKMVTEYYPATDWQDLENDNVKYYWKKYSSFTMCQSEFLWKNVYKISPFQKKSNWMIKSWWFISFQLDFWYLVFIALVPFFSPALWHKSRLCHLLTASITKNLKHQQRLPDLGWFHSSSLQTKRSFLFEKMSEHYCEKIEIFRRNLHYKRCRNQVVFRVALLRNKCYFWLRYFQLAVFLGLFNLCFLCVGVLWIFHWNVNSSKLFTDIDQFYNFIHFAFYTSIFRLYQNTG